MTEKKKILKKIINLLLLIVAIIILFYWYTTQNRERMEERNKSYAADSARLKASQIDDELNNALNLIDTYAYYLEESLTAPVITTQMLLELENHSLFDNLRFTDMYGNNYASDGRISDATERDYYLNGMNGESGISVISNSMITGKAQVGFYTPVYYNGEIIGVLRGLYQAEEYLQDMLATTYFNEAADVFLCMPDGTVISSSDTNTYEGNLLDLLTKSGVIDENTAALAKEVFKNGGEETFLCSSDSKTDNICVMYLPENDYVLVQTFPKSITQAMIKAENQIGFQLELGLIGLFIVYIILLLVQLKKQKKVLEQENQEMGYIISGINTLFTRFLMVDLDTDTYQYLAGTRPERKELPTSGSYPEIIRYLASRIPDEDDRREFIRQIHKESIIKTLSDHDDLRLECRVLHDGHTEWEHLNIICLERKDGKAKKVLFTRQNITEIKEKELRIQAKLSLANRKERQYRMAITTNALYTYDFNLSKNLITDDIVQAENGQFVSLLKHAGLSAPCKASEWFERQKQFITEESLENYCKIVNTEHLKKCFEQGETEVIAKYWLQGLSGEKIYLRQSFIMTQDYDTDDIMVMVVAKERTQTVKKRMEQTRALKDALSQAQRANKAKSTFLSNMSHDIRTPLNAIIGFSTIALDHLDNIDQVKDCLQNVLSSGNHLLSLINDILYMSSLESEDTPIEEQECNLSELIHHLVNYIQPQANVKQHRLIVEANNISNEDVITDPARLNQIFINLLSNAIKYTPPEGTILFQIQQKPLFSQAYGDYVFLIKDNGIGMSPEFVPHIFEPFERESSATKSGIQGTGLGMTITKHIIDMMDGSISVQSELGKGSTFIVTLTLKLRSTGKAPTPASADFSGKRALLAEDILLNRKIAEVILKNAGFSVEFAPDGTDAVSMVENSEEYYYDVILMDLQMPVMDGFEATRIIRSLPRDDVKSIPIIAVTANAFEEDKEAALKSGMNAHVAKPINREEFINVLSHYLR